MKLTFRSITSIIFCVILSIMILYVFLRPFPEGYTLRHGVIVKLLAEEDSIMSGLKNISDIQKNFKTSCRKDKNNNGQGEYGDNNEIVEYAMKLDGSEKLYLNKDVNAIKALGNNFSSYLYKIFLPKETEQQEKNWICLAIPGEASTASMGLSYYIDEKGIIFFTEEDLFYKIANDEQLLHMVFSGGPFKYPINTSMWKILECPLEEYRKTHPWPKEDKKPDTPAPVPPK